MSPKMRCVTIRVRQNQVDGLSRVFGRTLLRTLVSERSGEFADGGLNIVEFADGVPVIDSGSDVLVFKLENGSQLVKSNNSLRLPGNAAMEAKGGTSHSMGRRMRCNFSRDLQTLVSTGGRNVWIAAES
jgi:hypothetical protein